MTSVSYTHLMTRPHVPVFANVLQPVVMTGRRGPQHDLGVPAVGQVLLFGRELFKVKAHHRHSAAVFPIPVSYTHLCQRAVYAVHRFFFVKAAQAGAFFLVPHFRCHHDLHSFLK